MRTPRVLRRARTPGEPVDVGRRPSHNKNRSHYCSKDLHGFHGPFRWRPCRAGRDRRVPAAPAGDRGGPAPLVVYNAQHESLTRAWADAFTRETGIAVVLRNGGDSDLANQIVQEGSASPADVFLTENSPAMTLVENAGLFASVDAGDAGAGARALPAVVGQVDRRRGALDGVRLQPQRAARRGRAEVARRPRVAAWKGRWAASPAGADFQAIVSAMLEIKGEAATAQWLAGMKANAASYRGNGAVLRAVNAGQVAAGVIYHYYCVRRPGEDRREHAQRVAALFQGQGSRCVRQRLGRGRAGLLEAAGERAGRSSGGSPRASGQEILRTGSSFEYAVAQWRRVESEARAARRARSARDRPVAAERPEGHRADDRRPACSSAPGRVRRGCMSRPPALLLASAALVAAAALLPLGFVAGVTLRTPAAVIAELLFRRRVGELLANTALLLALAVPLCIALALGARLDHRADDPARAADRGRCSRPRRSPSRRSCRATRGPASRPR